MWDSEALMRVTCIFFDVKIFPLNKKTSATLTWCDKDVRQRDTDACDVSFILKMWRSSHLKKKSTGHPQHWYSMVNMWDTNAYLSVRTPTQWVYECWYTRKPYMATQILVRTHFLAIPWQIFITPNLWKICIWRYGVISLLNPCSYAPTDNTTTHTPSPTHPHQHHSPTHYPPTHSPN